eukprot:456205_1
MSSTEYDQDNEEEEECPIVIDNGYSMKSGFASEEAPRALFPSIIGVPIHKNVSPPYDPNRSRDFYVGDEAAAKRGILHIFPDPIQHGIITSWRHMERIWHHVFYNELRVEPEDHSVLFTEIPLNPKSNKEKLAQIMFETFNIPAICIKIDAVLSLYATGKLTGTVLTSSSNTTVSVPVYEGNIISNAVNISYFGGKQLTDYLQRLLTENCYSFKTWNEKLIVNNIKEKLCYVESDFSKINHAINYELPDGQMIMVDTERFKCCEAMFDPNVIISNAKGIHKMIYDSINECDVEIRKDLYDNILLCGGNMLFDGIRKRLYAEIIELESEYSIEIDKYL